MSTGNLKSPKAVQAIQFGRQTTAINATSKLGHKQSRSRDDHADALANMREVEDELEESYQDMNEVVPTIEVKQFELGSFKP